MSEKDTLNQHPDGFLSYPTHRLTCYFEMLDAYQAAMRAFAEAGFDTGDIHVLHGSDGIEYLDIDGSRHGTLARLSRLLHSVMSDTEVKEMERMKEHLEQGHVIVAVPAADHALREHATRIMHDNGGHHITYFARFYIEDIEE